MSTPIISIGMPVQDFFVWLQEKNLQSEFVIENHVRINQVLHLCREKEMYASPTTTEYEDFVRLNLASADLIEDFLYDFSKEIWSLLGVQNSDKWIMFENVSTNEIIIGKHLHLEHNENEFLMENLWVIAKEVSDAMIKKFPFSKVKMLLQPESF
jgi:hypothetical protein